MAARAGATHALAEKSITTIRRPEPVAHDRRRDQLWRHQPEGLGIGEDKSIVKFRPAGSREGLSDYLRDGCADIACTAFGAVPFVEDSAAVMREAYRILRPGGRWVFSVTHPMRWIFLDDPGEGGLVAVHSYFDRRPYVEYDGTGAATYVEHHRTLGDRIRELVAAGFVLTDLIEPEWPDGHEGIWGQWSPLRGRIFPGTAIFVTRKPHAAG